MEMKKSLILGAVSLGFIVSAEAQPQVINYMCTSSRVSESFHIQITKSLNKKDEVPTVELLNAPHGKGTAFSQSSAIGEFYLDFFDPTGPKSSNPNSRLEVKMPFPLPEEASFSIAVRETHYGIEAYKDFYKCNLLLEAK